ncbi:hypothetical protein O5264_28315, partial [Escherichia coli]|nr:hypothetical protein [Escherichia coli]
ILKDKEYPITIYNIAPFNKDLWSLLKSSQECPPGESKITTGKVRLVGVSVFLFGHFSAGLMATSSPRTEDPIL